MENRDSKDAVRAKQKLQEAARAKRSATLTALAFSTAAVGMVVIIFFALLDYFLMLVPSVRFAGLFAACVLVGGGVFKLVQFLKRPTPLKEAALDAEASKPEIGCELSTAAEYLSGERMPSQDYEHELAAALKQNAAQHLQKVQIPYWERLIRPVLIVAALLLLAVFFAVLASGGLTALKRATMPWKSASYTQVEVFPGDVEIPIGNDLDVKSVFTGRIPRDAAFHWLDDHSEKWQLAALTRNSQGEFTYPLKNVRNSLKYRVSGSDALSSEFTVAPYVPADVREWNIELEFPAYTRLPKQKLNIPDLTVLRGAVASIQITPTTKLSSARLKFKEGPAIDLHPTENGFWKADLKIASDAEFTVELADEKGRPDLNDSVFAIKALPDEPPRVEIAEPGQDSAAVPTNTVAVKISAMDDFGINELKLVYHRLGGPEQIIVAKRAGETNTEFTAEIPLSSLGLKGYELVAYHALAIDNNTLDGPGIGKSEVYFIEITDKESGECKSQGQGQQVNLLVVQKQIIADTVALGSDPSTDNLNELAKRQKDAVEFGRMYEKAISASATNSAVSSEMTAAVADMERAQLFLEQQNASLAIAPEESALARLYKIVGMMPELEDMPTVPPPPPRTEEEKEEKPEQPPVLRVVLEEIKKKKEEDPDNQEVAALLDEAQRLQEEQSSLTIGLQPTEGESKSQAKGGSGETDLDRSGRKPDQPANSQENLLAQNEQPSGEKPSPNKETKSKQSGKAQSKKGEGKGSGEKAQTKAEKARDAKKGEKAKAGTKPGEKSTQKSDSQKAGGKGQKTGDKNSEKQPSDPGKEQPEKQPELLPKDELALKQEELSMEAKALAEKLQRLAGKDSRIGHGIAQKMNEAGEKMGEAASAISKGQSESAGVHGAQAGAALHSAVAMLENALLGRSERIDVSPEEAPRQYEALISEYFRALSYDN